MTDEKTERQLHYEALTRRFLQLAESNQLGALSPADTDGICFRLGTCDGLEQRDRTLTLMVAELQQALEAHRLVVRSAALLLSGTLAGDVSPLAIQEWLALPLVRMALAR